MSRRPLLLASLLFVACVSPLSLPEDVHVFGQYQVCLTRLGDTCADEAGSCRSLAAESKSMLIGVRRESGEFLLAREGLEPLSGVLEGTRFRVQSRVSLPDVCGCEAEAVELIEGELLGLPVGEISCSAPAGSSCGEAFEMTALAPNEGEVDFDKRYPAIRGRVTNTVRAVAGGTGCSCLPCEAGFDFLGRP